MDSLIASTIITSAGALLGVCVMALSSFERLSDKARIRDLEQAVRDLGGDPDDL